MSSLRPGTRIDLDHRKWDGSQHWQNPGALCLGRDQWGAWLGAPAGVRVSRPGHEFWTEHDAVALVAPGQPWLARFYDRPAQPDQVSVYVDICSVPQWHLDETPVRLSLIDLDLDVVRRGETTFIDDEDEFAEHQVAYGYPTEVVERCERAAADVLRQVTDRTGPFAPEVAEHWLGVLRDLRP